MKLSTLNIFSKIMLLFLVVLTMASSAFSMDPMNLTIEKSTNTLTINESDNITYTINITNFNSSTNATNFLIRDSYQITELNYTNASVTPDSINYTSGEVVWNLTIENLTSTIIQLNMSSNGTGGIINSVFLQNSTMGNIANSSVQVNVSTAQSETNYSAPFNFSMVVKYANGTNATNVNGSLSINNGTNTSTIYSTNVSNGTLTFYDIAIPQGQQASLTIYGYPTSDVSAIPNGVSPFMPEFENFMYYEFLNNRTIYLSPSVGINLTAYNSTGDLIQFDFDIIDSNNGFPILSSGELGLEGVSEAIFTMPATRDYHVQIYPNGPPVKFALPESTINSSIGSIYNLSINTTFNFREVSGTMYYENGSVMDNLDSLDVISFDIFGSNGISFDGLMPQNLCSVSTLFGVGLCEGGDHNDTVNSTSGFYNISTPANNNGLGVLFIAFANKGSDYYMGYSNTTAFFNGTSYENNITLSPMFGTLSNMSFGHEIEELANVSSVQMNFTIETLVKEINISAPSYDNASENATLENVFVEAETFRNGEEYSWFIEFNSSTSSSEFFITNDTNLTFVRVFSDQYAPQKKTIDKDSSVTYVELAQFDLQSYNESGELDENVTGDFSVLLTFKVDSSTCSPIDPPASCDLLNGDIISATDFDPLMLLTNEPVRMDMEINGSDVKLLFYGVDLFASGPPDAVLNTDPNNETDGNSVWTFGSFAPDVYDFVYVAAPLNSSFHNSSAEINLSFQYLYDQDFNVTWNFTADGPATTAGDLPVEYQDFFPEYAAYFNGTGVECTPTTTSSLDSTSTDTLCYVVTDVDYVLFKLLHFSGVGAQITSNTSTWTANTASSSSSSGGGGGGGGGTFGSTSSSTTSSSSSTEVSESESEEISSDAQDVLDLGIGEEVESIELEEEKTTEEVEAHIDTDKLAEIETVNQEAFLAITEEKTENKEKSSAKVKTTSKVYKVSLSGGGSEEVTKIEKEVEVDIEEGESHIRIVEYIPKEVAESASKITGDYEVLVDDPVIAFHFPVEEVEDGKVTVEYTVSGDISDNSDEILTTVFATEEQEVLNTGSQEQSAPAVETTQEETSNDEVLIDPAESTGSSKGWISLIGFIVLVLIGLGIFYFLKYRREKEHKRVNHYEGGNRYDDNNGNQ